MILAPIAAWIGDLEHLPRNQFAHLRDQRLAALVGEVAVHDDRERVHRLARDQDVELHHRRFPVAGEVIVERGVAARDRLQAVVEIEHDFVQRQLVGEHHARRADVFEVLLLAALVFHQLQDAADIFFVGEDRRQ